MHRSVYYHKTTYAFEEASRQLLRRVRDRGQYDFPGDGDAVLDIVRGPQIVSFTDAFVDSIVHRAADDDDAVVRTLARSVQNRRPPRLLKEVCVLEDRNAQHHAGSAFWQKARVSLKGLAEQHGIPLGQFLLSKIKPLRLEERGSLLTPEEARALPPEEQDELIKVFIGNETEPRSLVDVKHSLIQICAGRFFQTFRLYVVYDGVDEDDIVSRLRDAVRDWGRPAR